MPQVPDTTLFLLWKRKWISAQKLYKAVKNAGKIVEFTTQTEELLDTLDPDTLEKKEGKSITVFCHAAFFEQDRNGYGQY